MTRSPRPVLLLTVVGLAFVPAAGAAAASPAYPTVSKVSPLKAGVGDTLTVRGRHFRAGRGRNTVVFKRTGGRAVFVKAGKSTRTTLAVTIPAKMLPALGSKAGTPVATRFRVRVLTSLLGKAYTSAKASPVIGPRAVVVGKTVTPADCDGDHIPNATDPDDDNDLLSDTLEATLGTDPCKRDTDGDGMSDGWEQESALDYNGRALPSPTKRPYPNALDPKDGAIDSDGDAMTNAQEYAAWAAYGQDTFPLNYSGGTPTSDGRVPPPPGREWADRDHNGYLSDAERDADGDGLPNQEEDLIDGFTVPDQHNPVDANGHAIGAFSTTFIERPDVRAVVDDIPLYGPLSQTHKVLPLSWLDKDSDGDGVVDGDDDQDGDGLSNVDELKTQIGAPAGTDLQLPINACAPNLDARMCIFGDADIDNDGIPNRVDDDDDGDHVLDTVERQYGLNPFKADTDGDGVDDGFEYYSAKDLNGAAAPYPGKKPYPNPLDGSDAGTDFDGDGLLLRDEFAAWKYTGSPMPLSYSDGNARSGGSSSVTDDLRDVDGDGLSNFDESHGRMQPGWWVEKYGEADLATGRTKESAYPTRTFSATKLDDPDTDGDGIPDGADDEDHDGFSNAFEIARPLDWQTTYVSTAHPGTNSRARVNPFNPCKPYYSSACHLHPPFGYYTQEEDWESPVHADGP